MCICRLLPGFYSRLLVQFVAETRVNFVQKKSQWWLNAVCVFSAVQRDYLINRVRALDSRWKCFPEGSGDFPDGQSDLLPE